MDTMERVPGRASADVLVATNLAAKELKPDPRRSDLERITGLFLALWLNQLFYGNPGAWQRTAVIIRLVTPRRGTG